MKKQTYYSNGKLLLTAEYVVLDGAKALALPTKFGQNLIVEPINSNTIKWKSFDADGSIWFEDTLNYEDIISNTASNESHTIKNTLTRILHNAYLLKPDFLSKSTGYAIETNLTFPKFWGLGTSSTLLNNIAQWTGVDAFTLLQNSFGGSGYDVFCAQNNTAILYQLVNKKPIVVPVIFNPVFSDAMYFVYLNKKQDSKQAIDYYTQNKVNSARYITKIDEITQAVWHSKTVSEFENLLQEHENYLSIILNQPTVKQQLFHDFKGTIKSLGAWGGDFVLVVSPDNPTNYFLNKGYKIVIPYNKMIL